MSDKYDDIINLDRPISKNHAKMSQRNRAAQFAPFAALTGFDDAVEETARTTDMQNTVNDDEILLIDSCLRILKNVENKHPKVRITYFLHDERKDGGKYITTESNLLKIDTDSNTIILTDNQKIPFCDILHIDSRELDPYRI